MSYNSTWSAELWMGSDIGTQHVEVQAPTYGGAKALIERIYRPEQIFNLYECGPMSHKKASGSGSFSSSSSGGGDVSGAVAGAVVGGTIGLVGWGARGIGNLWNEAQEENEREEAEARAAGGKVWEEYQEKQEKAQKLGTRIFKYGGSYLLIGALGALEVPFAPVLATGWFGYVGYKVYTKWIKKDKNNNPPQVEEKYRKESIK